jgi:alpha-D-ribose 1-methylphosphonate 5-triphosphate synthase subunit PhnL
MIFGNYRSDAGEILLRHVDRRIDIASARPREMIALRRDTIGYVSQFLRAIPRVPTIDIVAEQLLPFGLSRDDAHKRAADMLRRLNISERLWDLPPATFSGGEQQRVNIARGFLPDLPLLLLDEPTASLDADNRAVVVDLIAEKKKRGTAIVAIAHDEEIRDAIADEIVDIRKFAAAA